MDGINDADKLITMYAMPTYVLFVVFMLTKVRIKSVCILVLL